jgi:hypothetical protein
MIRQTAVAGLMVAGMLGPLSAQAKKPAAAKSTLHEITIKTDESVYSGTMDLAVSGGKVTGKMLLTSPTEITGKVAGTAKAGAWNLDFPYHMTERNRRHRQDDDQDASEAGSWHRDAGGGRMRARRDEEVDRHDRVEARTGQQTERVECGAFSSTRRASSGAAGGNLWRPDTPSPAPEAPSRRTAAQRT